MLCSVPYVTPSPTSQVIACGHLYTCISQICISQRTRHRPTIPLYAYNNESIVVPPACTSRPSSPCQPPTAHPSSSQKPHRVHPSTASKSLSQLSVSAPCVGVCGVSSHYSRSPICPSHRHTQHTKSVPAPVRTVLPLRTGTCRPPPWQREIKMRAVGRSPCGSNLPNWVVRKGPVGGMNCSYFFATHPVATVNDHLLVKSNFLRF